MGPLLYLQSAELRQNLVRAIWIVLSFMLLCEIAPLSDATCSNGPAITCLITHGYLTLGVQNQVRDYLLSTLAGNSYYITPLWLLAVLIDISFTDRPPLRWHVLLIFPGIYVLLWLLGLYAARVLTR